MAARLRAGGRGHGPRRVRARGGDAGAMHRGSGDGSARPTPARAVVRQPAPAGRGAERLPHALQPAELGRGLDLLAAFDLARARGGRPARPAAHLTAQDAAVPAHAGHGPAFQGRADRLHGGRRSRQDGPPPERHQSPDLAVARRHRHAPKDRSIEAELKFRLKGPADHARLRAALRKLGGKLEGSYKEENFRFEGRGKSTRRNTLRLRVLDGGPRGVITAKGPAQFREGVKVREETEVAVEDGHAMLDLLQQLGFRVLVVYRKHRAVWKLGPASITLDRLDFGYFTEVER